ncbi:MAG: lipopolysaccharide biosynthesis protein [Prevotella sp.]|nr:lipopolysaccharide biosynthesis protein [Prevotella sp.]
MTNKRKIYYMLHSGKNSKMKFFAKAYMRQCIPSWLSRRLLRRELLQLEKRNDREDILRRVDYYCKLTPETPYNREDFIRQAVSIKDQPVIQPKVYYFDAMDTARYFDRHYRWVLKAGDVADLQSVPTILKSRPIGDNNHCSVVLNLNKVRHFLFVNDSKAWRDKRDVAIFRGDVGNPKDGNVKPNRVVFMNRWYGHPLIDAASIDYIEGHPEWQKEKLTIGEHLDYKFVMSLEGNDVASNLKWVMSSNSIAVTPRLTCETWFMEGTLIPNYHYIEVKPDFSDLEERLTYYIQHPEEAEAIIRHAHEYVAQFQDKKRERLISLLVLKKYFDITNSSL